MKALDEFLDDGAPPALEPEAVVAVEPVVEPAVEEPVVERPADEEPQPGARVPVAALQAERVARQDWKDKFGRADAELAALRPQLDELQTVKAQLAELQKARTEPPVAPLAPPPPEVIPNPVEDLAGFMAYQQRQQQQALWNERLNSSEAMLRDQLGDADVDAKLAVFKKAAEANPALRAGLAGQAHPYKWAYTQAQRISAMEQIGTDPEAFKKKLIAEERAKWEAEVGVAAQAPVVVLPQSLAGARNAGARTQTEEAAPDFDSIFDKSRFTRSKQT